MPEHEIVRVLRCTRGAGVVQVAFRPRTGVASWNDKLIDRGRLRLRVETREGLLTLRADLPLVVSADQLDATGHQLLRAGDAVHLSLSWTADAPVVLPPLGAWSSEVIRRTLQSWNDWSALTRCDGAYRDAVVRSAIVIRLLTYAPSGAILAAGHDFIARKPRGTPQLGLPILLAARCVVHRACPGGAGPRRRGHGVRQLAAPRNAADSAAPASPV